MALGFLLAGCLQQEPSATEPAPDLAVPTADTGSNATIPLLGPAVDPWSPGERERALFEGDVQAGECYPGAVAGELVFGQYLMGGCAFVELPEGSTIPAGSAALRIEADASRAAQHGQWFAFLYTKVRRDYRQANGGNTQEATHTWRFALAPDEWDTGRHPSAFAGLWTDGGVLQGPVHLRIVAEHDPNWTAQPPIDRWRQPGHRFPQLDVMSLLEWNGTWSQPAYRPVSTPLDGAYDEWLRLQDRVPAGTSRLVVAASWGAISGCPSGLECTLRIDAASGGRFFGGYSGHPPAEAGAGHVIYTFAVPEEAAADADWQANSTTEVWPYFANQCPAPADGPMAACKRTLSDTQAPIRVLVEAWKGAVDLAAVRGRLGLP